MRGRRRLARAHYESRTSGGGDDWLAAGDETEAVTASGGNVFADLALADKDDLAAKADLARAIRQLVEARGLSPRAAAPLLGVSQSDLSNLYRRRLDGFSIGRLSRMLTALGQDVQIVVQPTPRSRTAGTIRTLLRRAARRPA